MWRIDIYVVLISIGLKMLIMIMLNFATEVLVTLFVPKCIVDREVHNAKQY